MKKDRRTIALICVLSIALIVSSACDMDKTFREAEKGKTKGIVAIVYSDLSKSINEEIANRQKENIDQLFRRLPVNTKFFLFSIDRGTSKPNIYQFIPQLPEVRVEADRDKLKKAIAENEKAKETTEAERLSSSLNSYYGSITKQDGPVSCISNRLNALVDEIRNQKETYRDYEIRIFFYSDMIEQCDASFDGKPLKFKKATSDAEEAKDLQDIQTRIDQNFQQTSLGQDLKSGTKIYIVQTSQDDKQSPTNLKTIWNAFFSKLGFEPKEIVWANGNHESFWKVDK